MENLVYCAVLQETAVTLKFKVILHVIIFFVMNKEETKYRFPNKLMYFTLSKIVK